MLDTNIVIALVAGLIALTGSSSSHYISVITLVELCKTTTAAANGLDAYVRDLLHADAMIADSEIAKIARDLRIKSRIKVPDAVIAATSLHHGLTLVTEDRQLLAIPNIGAIGYDKFMEEMGASND